MRLIMYSAVCTETARESVPLLRENSAIKQPCNITVTGICHFGPDGLFLCRCGIPAFFVSMWNSGL